ncbi:hypothetical protein GQ607_013354 [Colletotrichum asianum]|uniref:Uncharacterized protein n=1 Tax=Colletotrichum asianum TaxID=702518 RepID=A0A8H3W571_9PEZI|nr:hypothetical protein GQ607_013354 [Colletotrichum asianum]
MEFDVQVIEMSKIYGSNTRTQTRLTNVIAFTPESTASPASPQCLNVPSTPPLLRPVRQHWTAESIPLVLDCYSSINFLPGLFKGVPDDHCLVRTSQVFARAYVLNRYRPNTDYRELSSCLGKALASVSAAINDPKAHTSDTTIVAVWFLGNYELLMGGLERRSFLTPQEKAISSSPGWYIHTQGLMSLLRARGDSQLFTRSGRKIFWTMHNIIQIRCTTINEPCPPEFDHWFKIIAKTLQPGEALLLETGRYIAATCSLLSKMMPIARLGDAQQACAQYEDLLAECDKAELAMLEWIQSAPQYQFESGPVFHYFWSSWRSARIKLHHMLILVTNIVEHAPECPFQREALRARRELCLEIIGATAQDIVDGIPKSLGGSMSDMDPQSPAAYFDALRLIWPLSQVYVMPTVPRHMRKIARNALSRIGREKGILVALQPRPGGIHFPPEAMAGICVDDLGDREHPPNDLSDNGPQSP